MACSISLTADMAGEGTERRSPTRHPRVRSTTAALIEEPPISMPIACRCIPRLLEAVVVQREDATPSNLGNLCPCARGAYDTGLSAPDIAFACNVGSAKKNVLKCLVEERKVVRVLNEPTLGAGAILRRGSLRAAIYDRLTRSLGKEPETATPRDIYDALSLARARRIVRPMARDPAACRARAGQAAVLPVGGISSRPLPGQCPFQHRCRTNR